MKTHELAQFPVNAVAYLYPLQGLFVYGVLVFLVGQSAQLHMGTVPWPAFVTGMHIGPPQYSEPPSKGWEMNSDAVGMAPHPSRLHAQPL